MERKYLLKQCLDKDLVPNYDKVQIRPTDTINVIIPVSTSNLTSVISHPVKLMFRAGECDVGVRLGMTKYLVCGRKR
jgi:hypothetical protein